MKNSDQAQEVDEEFEERAAIMQYDGGLSRSEAERQARELLKKQKGLFDGSA